MSIALGRQSAARPVAPEPTGQLTVDEVAQLLATVDPESFYRQAEVIDGLVNHLQDTVDRYRNQLRHLEQAWGGGGTAQADRLDSLGWQVDGLLNALREPSYPTLLRQAGDAAAESRQRLQLLQQHGQAVPTPEHAAAPTPRDAVAPAAPPPAGQSDDDHKAQQILQDLSDVYSRVGRELSMLPERTAMGTAVPGLVARDAPAMLRASVQHTSPGTGSVSDNTTPVTVAPAHTTRHRSWLCVAPDAFLPASVLPQSAPSGTVSAASGVGEPRPRRHKSEFTRYATAVVAPAPETSTLSTDRKTQHRSDMSDVDTGLSGTGTPEVNALLSAGGVLRSAHPVVGLGQASMGGVDQSVLIDVSPWQGSHGIRHVMLTSTGVSRTVAAVPATVSAGAPDPTVASDIASGLPTAVSHGPVTSTVTTTLTTTTGAATGPQTPAVLKTATAHLSLPGMDIVPAGTPAPAPVLSSHSVFTPVSGSTASLPAVSTGSGATGLTSAASITVGSGLPPAQLGAQGPTTMPGPVPGGGGGGPDLAGTRQHAVQLIAEREHWMPTDTTTSALGRKAPARHDPGKFVVLERSDC